MTVDSSNNAGGNSVPVFPDNQPVAFDPQHISHVSMEVQRSMVTATVPPSMLVQTSYGPAQPHNVILRSEVAQLQNILLETKTQADYEIQAQRQNFTTQAEQAIAQQRVGFEHAALQFEDQARAVVARDVASATARVETYATERLQSYQKHAAEIEQNADMTLRSAEGNFVREQAVSRQLEDKSSEFASAYTELESQLMKERNAYQTHAVSQDSFQASVLAQLENKIAEGDFERQRQNQAIQEMQHANQILHASLQEQMVLADGARVERNMERKKDQEIRDKLEEQLVEMQRKSNRLDDPISAPPTTSVREQGGTSSLIETLLRNARAAPEQVTEVEDNPLHFRIGSPENEGRHTFFDEETPTFVPKREESSAKPETLDLSAFLRLQESQTQKGKESDYIRLEQLPTVPKFKGWLLSFRKDVASAAGKPEAGFKWISAVETAASPDALADSGEFQTLDCKLSAALGKIFKWRDRKASESCRRESSQAGQNA
jgi:hypothetical protein